MFRLEKAGKSFGDVVALQPTDLEVERGRSTVLIGPSGCGKSTLLRLLVGLLTPSTGKVLFGDREITPDNVLELRREMGYVIQDGGLFPHLTARDNVALLARFLGWDAAKIDARVDELAELTRLPAGALDRFPTQVSGGQRQRVGIMRALMLDPPVMLLDEPLGALDPLVRYDLQEDLRQIFRSLGKTVVLVTHDMAEAAHFGDTVAILQSGRIVQQGPIRDLVERPANDYVRRFINAQRMTLDGSENGG
ncbi:Glycine betaine/carnitine/choline transport ATP-binding protein OpuCA [Pirellulimonas nuda]|uniref:Glycine betaine/carnitine/choline transport ATP-binding protein OpuCA n=1 Tax=Pirellulimonas nuda TaxID=2528009 RepID=A0A518DB44_9BACT|nr:ATP-binding cassette domain-containing protein [Pirellulimonas nuda]QDU88688.1 Glycine betaine/carnitine/choline transport ATP-binding protein OpuCA [Pirellulimonas nuda]